MLYAVWFTHVAARRQILSDPEWHEWQLLDSDDLRDVPEAIARTIQMGIRHLDQKVGHFSAIQIGPDHDSATRIASVLRPKFDVTTSPGERRRARETQLLGFVDEQYRALDAAADNRAVPFSGPAGCGKTFLAIESARREVASGKRGRLLCFNRSLGKRLASESADVKGLTVNTLHQEFLRIANYPKAPHDAAANFWEVELPDRAIESLLEGGNSQMGEFLVSTRFRTSLAPRTSTLSICWCLEVSAKAGCDSSATSSVKQSTRIKGAVRRYCLRPPSHVRSPVHELPQSASDRIPSQSPQPSAARLSTGSISAPG